LEVIDGQLTCRVRVADAALAEAAVVAIRHFLLPGMRHPLSLRDADGLRGLSTHLPLDPVNLILQFPKPAAQLVVLTTEGEELIVKLFQGREVCREGRGLFLLAG
jgi:hypothetical protein